MQINFTPRKIKKAKEHIDTLLQTQIEKTHQMRPSFFKRVLKLITKPFNIGSKL